MISKTSIGRSFEAIIGYCIDSKTKGKKDRGEILVTSNCGDKHQLIKQFNDVKNTHKGVKAVWHTSFSFAPGDRDILNESILIDVAQEFGKECGFEQFAAIIHQDTKDRFSHFHFKGNRVNLNKKIVSDSHSYRKVTAFCRRMEKKHGLTEVLSPKAFLSKEMAKTPRIDNRKEELKLVLKDIFKDCSTIPELKDRLTEKGYTVEIQRGIAITDSKKVRYKGSQLGYQLNKIILILQENLFRMLNKKIDKGHSKQLTIN